MTGERGAGGRGWVIPTCTARARGVGAAAGRVGRARARESMVFTTESERVRNPGRAVVLMAFRRHGGLAWGGRGGGRGAAGGARRGRRVREDEGN